MLFLYSILDQLGIRIKEHSGSVGFCSKIIVSCNSKFCLTLLLVLGVYVNSAKVSETEDKGFFK